MDGKLIIEGDLSALAELAHRIQQLYPEGVHAEVIPEPWQGWTVDYAQAVFDACASAARTALQLVSSAGGFVPDEEVRAIVGDQLKGKITGPISKQMQRLASHGWVPEGLPKPLTASYTDSPSYQRIGGFRMPEQLVPIFVAAIERAGRAI